MLVEFTADDSVVLTEGSRAVIRYDDLIGGRYLALEEGAGGTKKLNPGDTIPLAQTAPALDLDALIGGFRPLFRALDPDQVNALSGQLISALQGQGATIESFLAQTAALTNTLADRDQLIGAGHRQPEHRAGFAWRTKRSVRQGRRLAVGAGRRDLPSGRQDISNAVAYTNAAAGSIADLLAQARPRCRRSSHETDRAAGIVVADHDYFDNLLNTLPDAYQVLNRQGLYGDFFSFYLCDLVLKLNGKGGQPVYVKVAGQDTREVRAAMKSFAERNPLRHRRGRRRRSPRRGSGGPELPEAAVLQLGQDVLGVLRRGRRSGRQCRGAGLGLCRRARSPASNSTAQRVLVTFKVDKNIRLGDRTEAAIKTKSLLGAKILEVTPRGDGAQSRTIPIDRTTSPYQLPDALGDLATTISGLNTDQLSDVAAGARRDVLRDAARSEGCRRGRGPILGNPRQTAMRSCANCSPTPTRPPACLSERSDQMVRLMANTNALLAELQSQSAALDQISGNISAAEPADQGRHRREPRTP